MTLRGIEAVLFPAYFALTLLGFMLFFGAARHPRRKASCAAWER